MTRNRKFGLGDVFGFAFLLLSMNSNAKTTARENRVTQLNKTGNFRFGHRFSQENSLVRLTISFNYQNGKETVQNISVNVRD